jgi:hypothetical protein
MAWRDRGKRGYRVGLLPARGNVLGGMLQPPAHRRLMTSHCSGRCRTHDMYAAERDDPSPIGGYGLDSYQKPTRSTIAQLLAPQIDVMVSRHWPSQCPGARYRHGHRA